MDCHFGQECKHKGPSFMAVCCIPKCHRKYCESCIVSKQDKCEDFAKNKYRGDTWICYYCQNCCKCLNCANKALDGLKRQQSRGYKRKLHKTEEQEIKPQTQAKIEKAQITERSAEKGDRLEKTEKVQRTQRVQNERVVPSQPEKVEKQDTREPENNERAQKVEKSMRVEKQEKVQNYEKLQKIQHQHKKASERQKFEEFLNTLPPWSRCIQERRRCLLTFPEERKQESQVERLKKLAELRLRELEESEMNQL